MFNLVLRLLVWSFLVFPVFDSTEQGLPSSIYRAPANDCPPDVFLSQSVNQTINQAFRS